MNSLKTILIGLSTPPSVFDGSSSNRSTAVVQLDSEKSGRVLFQQFIQYKLAQWIQVVINMLLEMRGYPADCVWVNFNPKVESDDNDDGNEETNDIKTENGTTSTSKPGDGLDLNHITDTNRGVAGATV